MKIEAEEIDWKLFKKCTNFSMERGDPKERVPSYYFEAGERACKNGSIGVPASYLTKGGKQKWQFIRETCKTCNGTGYIPTEFGQELVKMFQLIIKFNEGTADINKDYVPDKFIVPRTSYYD